MTDRALPDGTSLLGTAFWVSVIVVSLVITFSMLIMGLCAVDSSSPALVRLGLTCIIAGPAILLCMYVAALVSRGSAGRGGAARRLDPRVAIGIFYVMGAPALTLATWLGVCHFVEAPMYQEANTEVPTTIPVY